MPPRKARTVPAPARPRTRSARVNSLPPPPKVSVTTSAAKSAGARRATTPIARAGSSRPPRATGPAARITAVVTASHTTTTHPSPNGVLLDLGMGAVRCGGAVPEAEKRSPAGGDHRDSRGGDGHQSQRQSGSEQGDDHRGPTPAQLAADQEGEEEGRKQGVEPEVGWIADQVPGQHSHHRAPDPG